jgi:hypothetical protein
MYSGCYLYSGIRGLFLVLVSEQKQIVVCLVHQLIFIQYSRKLRPLQEAPILISPFFLINVEVFQYIRATKEL